MADWKAELAISLAASEPEELPSGETIRNGKAVAWFGAMESRSLIGCVNAAPVLDFAAGTILFHTYDWSPPGPARVGFTHRSRPWNDGVPLDANSQPLHPEVDFDAAFSDRQMFGRRPDGQLAARSEPAPETVPFEPYRKIARDPIPKQTRVRKGKGASSENGDVLDP